jgi:hypothetical protein
MSDLQRSCVTPFREADDARLASDQAERFRLGDDHGSVVVRVAAGSRSDRGLHFTEVARSKRIRVARVAVLLWSFMSQYCTVAFTDTLMAWDNDLQFHVQSGDHHSTFFFRGPDAWRTLSDEVLQAKIFAVAQQMYVDLNAGFRAAEPDDISYMLVKATQGQLLDAAGVAAKPWLAAPNPAVWESTPCVVVNDDGSYAKVPRDGF